VFQSAQIFVNPAGWFFSILLNFEDDFLENEMVQRNKDFARVNNQKAERINKE
jgi:hypothetical protein